jgi:hypothetical protein
VTSFGVVDLTLVLIPDAATADWPETMNKQQNARIAGQGSFGSGCMFYLELMPLFCELRRKNQPLGTGLVALTSDNSNYSASHDDAIQKFRPNTAYLVADTIADDDLPKLVFVAKTGVLERVPFPVLPLLLQDFSIRDLVIEAGRFRVLSDLAIPQGLETQFALIAGHPPSSREEG